MAHMVTKATKKVLSTTEAAGVARLSVRRIVQFCEAGRLGFRVGENWAIPDDQLRDFLKTPRKAGRPPRQK